MVLEIAALLASALGTSAAAIVPTGRLPEIFVAACLDGSVSLSPGDAGEVAVENLPPALRNRLGKPTSGQVWRLNSPGQAYLYVLDYPSLPGTDPKICGLASDGMSLDVATNALEMRIAGSVYPDRGKGLQLLMPKDGYIAIATKAGKFSIVQINWLSETDRAATEKHFRPVTP
jgi:hypothetical protein